MKLPLHLSAFLLTPNPDSAGLAGAAAAPSAQARGAEATGSPAAEGGPSSIRPPGKYNNNDDSAPKVLRMAFDTVELSYEGVLSEASFLNLSRLKELAQSEERPERSLAQVEFGGHLFQVLDKGQRPYSFILDSKAFFIKISKGGMVPLVYAQIGAEYLASVGLAKAEETLRYIANSLGKLTGEAKLSRIDPCVDMAVEWDLGAIKPYQWICRAREFKPHYDQGGRRCTGWSFGLGGDISGRVYNKQIEIANKSHALWVLLIWHNAGWNPECPVFRVEAQIRRPVLKQLGIDSLENLHQNARALWRYFSENWLRLATPMEDDDNASRWPTCAPWDQYQAVTWDQDESPALTRYQPERTPTEKRLLEGGFGYITSHMASKGITDWSEGVGTYLQSLRVHFDIGAKRPMTGFNLALSSRIADKGRRFGTIDNRDQDYEGKRLIAEQAEAYRLARDGDEDV